MKCSACGHSQFYKLTENPFTTEVRGEVEVKVPEITPDAFMCEQCGHVEFFVSNHLRLIEIYKNDVEALQTKTKELQELKSKIKSLRNESMSFDEEISNIKKFISDENNTVKAIKEAEAKLALIAKNKRELLNKSTSRSAQFQLDSLNKEITRLQTTLITNPLSK